MERNETKYRYIYPTQYFDTSCGGWWKTPYGSASEFTAGIVFGDYREAATLPDGRAYFFTVHVVPSGRGSANASVDFTRVTDAPNGTALSLVFLPVGGTLRAYASGYNQSSGYVGPIEVWWNGSGGIWTPQRNESSVFTAGAMSGTYVQAAENATLDVKDLFTIKILPPAPDALTITDLDGNVLSNVTLDVGRCLGLKIHAYNYTIGEMNVNATWDLETQISGMHLSKNWGNTSILYSGTQGGNALLRVQAGSATAQLNISVNPPTVDNFTVSTTPNGTPVREITLHPYEEVVLYASAYNDTIGYCGCVPVRWATSRDMWQQDKGWYWCGNYSTNSYSPNTNCTMYTAIKLTNAYPTELPNGGILGKGDAKSLFFAHEGIERALVFWQNIQIEEGERCQVLLQPVDADPQGEWEILAEYNKSRGWEQVQIDLGERLGDYRLAFRFISDKTSEAHGWQVYYPRVLEIYKGRSIVEVRSKPTEVRDYHINWAEMMAEHVLPPTISEVSTKADGIVRGIMESLARYISDRICTVLFHGQPPPRPVLNPKDRTSLLESASADIKRWLAQGLSALKAKMQNETFLKDAVREWIENVLSAVIEPFSEALNSAIGSVENWMQDTIFAAKKLLSSTMSSLVRRAGGLMEGVCRWFGMEEWYSSATSAISDLIDRFGDFWENLKENITTVLSTLSEKWTAVKEAFEDWSKKKMAEITANVLSTLSKGLCMIMDGVASYIVYTLDEMHTGGEISGTKFLQSIYWYDENGNARPFEFWMHSRCAEAENGTLLREKILISQGILYLDERIEGVSINLSMPIGLHNTDMKHITLRPFETIWKVEVFGALHITLSTPMHHFGKVALNRSLVLNFSVPIVVYSGWRLNGVKYVPTHTLVGDIISFFEKVWDKLKTFAKWIISALLKVIDLFTKLVEKIIEVGARIVKLINEVLNRTTALVQHTISSVGGRIGRFLLSLLDGENASASVSIGGLHIRILTAKDRAYTNATVRYGGKRGEIGFYANITDDWILVGGEGRAWHLTTFTIINTSANPLFHGTVCYNNSGSGWIFSFEGGVFEESCNAIEAALSDYIPGGITIPSPIPGVTLKLDMGVCFSFGNVGAIVRERVRQVLSAIFNETLKALYSWESLLSIAGKVKKILSDMLTALMHEISETTILEVFFDVVCEGGKLAGMGAKVSLLLTNALVSLRDILLWLIDKIETFLSNLVEKIKSIIFGAPKVPKKMTTSMPQYLPQVVFLQITLHSGVEIGGSEAEGGAYISLSFSAIGALLHKNWGEWYVYMGVYRETSSRSSSLIVNKTTTTYFRGTIQNL